MRSSQGWRFFTLNAGLLFLGLSISIMLKAGVGVDPWSVFHDGLAQKLPISFGTITLLSGLSLLVISILWLKSSFGIGSILNIILIGPYVDLFNMSGLVPMQSSLGMGICQLTLGVITMGLAIGLYINAGFGAGPRESLVLGISQRFGVSVRRAKTGIEAAVLVAGIALGGQFGLGTLIFALSIGFLMQTFLKILSVPSSQKLP